MTKPLRYFFVCACLLSAAQPLFPSEYRMVAFGVSLANVHVKSTEGKEADFIIDIGERVPTEPVKFTPGKLLTLYRPSEASEKKAPTILGRFTTPADGQNALLILSPLTDGTLQGKWLPTPLNTDGQPNLRLFNITPGPLAVQIDDTVIQLAPGDTINQRIATKNPVVQIKIAYATENTWKLGWSYAYRIYPGIHITGLVQVAPFDADGGKTSYLDVISYSDYPPPPTVPGQ
jgi:hypothetical protein